MTTAGAEAVRPDPGPHEWHRLAVGWHVVFGALTALTAALMALDDSLGAGRRLLGVVAVAALTAWYPVAGARLLRRPRTGGGWLYVGVAVALSAAAVAVAPVGAVLLFLLFPHTWAMLPPRQAVVGTFVAIFTVGAVLAAAEGRPERIVADVVVPMGLALVVTLAVGLWMTRIIEQSARRAALVAELAETRAALAEMSRHAGVLAERERMARDIHDTVVQGFTSVLLLLDALEAELADGQPKARGYLGRIRDTARDNLAEARSLVGAGTPPQLRSASLPEAVRSVTDRIRPDLPGGAALTVVGAPRPLPADREVVTLRVVQEAISNIVRHSGANRAEVTLEYTAAGLVLRVSDDGRGFDPAVVAGGFGLAGLRERVNAAGGVLRVRAAAGTGVTLVMELPA